LNTKSQIFIDSFIAKPIGFCLNFLVRIVGKILRIDHNLNKEFTTIVVCKFKGLGSIIQTTPMLQALREAHPNAEILFLSTKSNASFLKKIKTIDTVVTVDDSGFFKLIASLLRAILFLIRKRPEVYIDLEVYSNFSTLVALSTLAKNRIGFYLRSSSFKMGIFTHMMYYNTNVPISEVYLQIARLLNANGHSNKLYPLHESVSSDGRMQLDTYIIINPNASDLRIERRWDKLKFNALAEWLCSTYPEKNIVFIGSRAETTYVQEVVAGLDFSNLINLAGKTTMDELIQLISSAELVITNDTGPMHIAFACNTPTIALFGPCAPEQYGWNTNTKIIYKKVYCSPCVHEFSTPPCKGNNICMQLISLEEVVKEVGYFLENKNFSDKELQLGNHHVIYRKSEQVLGVVNRAK
jgi:ADP-heptose:LPS heptosyltransferase